MKEDLFTFDRLVEECLQNIRTHVFDGAGMQVSPAIFRFLSAWPNEEIVARIVDATNPAFKDLLVSNVDLFCSITSLAKAVDHTNQGVFADILTNDDESAIKIFVGAAAGPYKPRSGGMRGRIQGLQAEMRAKKSSTVLHFQAARTAGWRTNWVTLAAFKTRVDKEMVVVAQATMTVLLGSCPRSSYVACRPTRLKPAPQAWGLNEIAPLRLDGLATYYKGFDTMDQEEAVILRQKRAIASETTSFTASRRRQDRLRNGGPVRVYVLRQGGRVVRFHVTLMTAKDGAHVDITIPLMIGLEYGLQTTRKVDIKLELSARNHHTPFANKAAHNTNARRLGIILSGTRATGSMKGMGFTHWLQSPRKAALLKAEKLIQFLSKYHRHGGETLNDRSETSSRYVSWSGQSFVSTLEPVGREQQHVPSKRQTSHAVEQNDMERSGGQKFYGMLLETVEVLQRLCNSRKIRATPNVCAYLKTKSAKDIATMIAAAVRAPVIDILLSTTEFTASR
ncbi:hypothetical protein CDEST_09267 [Colletotrichum destructivum]|uniref:Uncharacterized protein n=1 Tax=Colletotrichum destructivum TaxID=34406 RepID=A0AAX4IMK5_9PEZI|nr:hypothetical protein CDEST_09267 [Colletotrichum destructivum]